MSSWYLPLPFHYHIEEASISHAARAMDWYSWLSKSSLDAGLIFGYSILFSDNELEEDDIDHFDHEFLQSMGISIAKHRLEILKLAKKHHKSKLSSPPRRPVARLLAAITKHARSLVGRPGNSAAIAIVAEHSSGSMVSRGAALLKRNQKQQLQELADIAGDQKVATPSPVRVSRRENPEDSSGEMMWDSMFQDLKPT